MLMREKKIYVFTNNFREYFEISMTKKEKKENGERQRKDRLFILHFNRKNN